MQENLSAFLSFFRPSGTQTPKSKRMSGVMPKLADPQKTERAYARQPIRRDPTAKSLDISTILVRGKVKAGREKHPIKSSEALDKKGPEGQAVIHNQNLGRSSGRC
jgi:hypothetical protein